MKRSVYLDHHATTPMDPRVLEAMMPYFTGDFGNPSSSTHDWGLRARAAVESARQDVAALLHARPREIVFTSGATEANNFALKGRLASGACRSRRHLVTTSIEHASILGSAEYLAEDGVQVSYAEPDRDGIVTADEVERHLRPETAVVSVCAANGEIGTLQPVADIGEKLRGRDICFHTDATQAVGKIDLDVRHLGCHLLSLSGHKMYGPKGVGALYIQSGVELRPLLSGGGQERGLRSGTLNVPGIVGLGAVARLRRQEMAAEAEHLVQLRERLWVGILSCAPDARLNGHPDHRLPGSLNVLFPRISSERMILALGDFALSAGSACHSGKGGPSPVLAALGMDADDALCCIRFGIGKSTTPQDIDRLLAGIEKAVRRFRGGRPAVAR